MLRPVFPVARAITQRAIPRVPLKAPAKIGTPLVRPCNTAAQLNRIETRLDNIERARRACVTSNNPNVHQNMVVTKLAEVSKTLKEMQADHNTFKAFELIVFPLSLALFFVFFTYVTENTIHEQMAEKLRHLSFGDAEDVECGELETTGIKRNATLQKITDEMNRAGDINAARAEARDAGVRSFSNLKQVAVIGPEGSGKANVVRWYAQQFIEKKNAELESDFGYFHLKTVAVLNARNISTFEDQYFAFAEALGIDVSDIVMATKQKETYEACEDVGDSFEDSRVYLKKKTVKITADDTERVITAVNEKLSYRSTRKAFSRLLRMPEEFLLIIENVSDFKDIEPFLPKINGHQRLNGQIIFTVDRTSVIQENSDIIPFKLTGNELRLSPSEVIEQFDAAFNDEDEKNDFPKVEKVRLGKLLQENPLLICRAAKLMKWKPEDYPDINSLIKKLEKNKEGNKLSEISLALTKEIVGKLDGDDAKFLLHLSFFNPDDIDIKFAMLLHNNLFKDSKKTEMAKRLDRLEQCGLLETRANGNYKFQSHLMTELIKLTDNPAEVTKAKENCISFINENYTYENIKKEDLKRHKLITPQVDHAFKLKTAMKYLYKTPVTKLGKKIFNEAFRSAIVKAGYLMYTGQPREARGDLKEIKEDLDQLIADGLGHLGDVKELHSMVHYKLVRSDIFYGKVTDATLANFQIAKSHAPSSNMILQNEAEIKINYRNPDDPKLEADTIKEGIKLYHTLLNKELDAYLAKPEKKRDWIYFRALRCNLGRAYLRQGEPEKALKLFIADPVEAKTMEYDEFKEMISKPHFPLPTGFDGDEKRKKMVKMHKKSNHTFKTAYINDIGFALYEMKTPATTKEAKGLWDWAIRRENHRGYNKEPLADAYLGMAKCETDLFRKQDYIQLCRGLQTEMGLHKYHVSRQDAETVEFEVDEKIKHKQLIAHREHAVGVLDYP